MQLAYGPENGAMVFTVKIAFDHHADQLIPGARGQQQAAQHGLFGLNRMRRGSESFYGSQFGFGHFFVTRRGLSAKKMRADKYLDPQFRA
jgi:hypothetical protein